MIGYPKLTDRVVIYKSNDEYQVACVYELSYVFSTWEKYAPVFHNNDEAACYLWACHEYPEFRIEYRPDLDTRIL